MSAAWPDLELLLRGELIATSPLSLATARDTMLEALRRRTPALAQTSDNGPDVAIVDALAACVEVMGFYHDRFLTESKLGSAQLLDSLARIAQLIGYRPLPAVAATAYQFFEAIAAGTVDAGTRVAGKLAVPPVTVAFETDAGIAISPEQNRMALSPVITRSAGARRAVVTQLVPGSALPTDDFRKRTDAMIADGHGLELAPVADSRSRAVAFGRALGRSFDASAAVMSRTTVVRHLRSPRTLAPDLVGFEVSEAPILHLPSAAAPEILSSTLEVFVLRPGDEIRDPSEWDPALRYREVLDFSGSEVADLHYRTFVDDALHTWILLRKDLGAHVLLDSAALGRVYVRFAPAVGSVLAPGPVAPGDGVSPAPELSGATLELDASYFLTSLVAPPVPGARLAANATWAMLDRDPGLSPGDSILIQDGGQSWVRTLIETPGSEPSPRLVRWAADPPAFTAASGLPRAHDPVELALDPSTAKIGALGDAATGDALPTWSELYAQLRPLGPPEPASDLPLVAASAAGVIERRRVVAAGSTYLVLGDASRISAGEYIVLGQRLTVAFRAPQPLGPWRARPGEPAFDPRLPWLDAEIVQALEVRGNVVRLASPVSKDYFRHEGRVGTGAATRLSEVIALPGAVSVAAGDRLRQTLDVTTQPTFTGADHQRHDATYLIGALDQAYPAEALRRPLLPPSYLPSPILAVQLKPPATKPAPPQAAPQDLWNRLFVAVAGLAEEQPGARWQLGAIVRACNLRAHPADIVRLEDARGTRLDTGDLAAALADEAPVTLASPAAAERVVAAADDSVVAVLGKPPSWQLTQGVPAAGEFRIDVPVGFDLVPEPHDLGRDYLADQRGTLVILPDPVPGKDPPAELRVPFRWDADASAPRVDAPRSAVGDHFEAIFVADTASLAVPPQPTASADWRIPAARFADPAFRSIDGGTFVAVTDDSVVFECPFARGSDGFDLTGVAVTSIGDPLEPIAAAWAVEPGDVRIAPSAAQAHWVFGFADPHGLPAPGAAIRLALVGERREVVGAHIGDGGDTAVVDPGDATTGDLGFALDALCVLDGPAIPAAELAAQTVWLWRGIDPPLTDLPEPRDARFVAVLASPDGTGAVTAAWQRDQVWWVPERRTLMLPTAPVDALRGARPSDVVRLIQVLAPTVERRQLTIRYDRTTDRSIVTLAMAPGWPGKELAPAPVVIATTTARTTEVRETVAPVDVLIDTDGNVRWSLHFAGDVQDRWRDLSVAVRDWSAPAERGLEEAPLWRIADAPERRARIAGGTAMLIAAARGSDDVVALAAVARVAGGAIELAPLGADDAFPDPAAVARVDLALRTVRRPAGTAMALAGSTILDLGTSVGTQLPPISHVVFEDGTRWRPIRVKAALPGRRFELDGAYLSVFPDGIAAQQPVRLCRATSALAATAQPATARTLRLRLPTAGAAPGHALAASAAVLHAGDLAVRAVLDAAAPPRLDADSLVVELALTGAGLAAVFDDQAKPRWTRLALAQRWPSSVAKSLQPQPLRVTLGSPWPYAITPGDVFALGFAQGGSVTAEVKSWTHQGALALDTTDPAEPGKLTLYGLRTRIDHADYSACLDLTPTAKQPPWLMSFSAEAAPDSLRTTFLPYARTGPVPGSPGVQRFVFAGADTLARIFRHADGPLYLFSNERDELRGEFYTETDDHVAKDLAARPPLNFLDPASTTVDRLVLTSSAWLARDLTPPRPVVLCSTEWTPSPSDPRLPRELFPEVKVVSARRGRVATGFALQSVRFNSGNFIPAAAQATAPADAAAVIASALRVSARGVKLDGTPLPDATWQTVPFAPLEQLVDRLQPKTPTPITLPDLEGLTYEEAVDSGKLTRDAAYAFSASFSATGACTLHFLFADRPLIETVQVRIEAQYEVTPERTGSGATDPIYPFETPVEPFDPATQLALLAPGQLRPGALVFVRTPPGPHVPELQWTQVTGVTGSIVDVDPPLAYVAGGSLEPTAVTGLGKLTTAARLDAEYYAALAQAKLTPGAPLPAPLRELVLPLGDRLALDVAPPAADQARLAALMPGDRVLVFDERSRRAWAARRQSSPAAGDPASTAWQAWPDDQHEAVVKRVDRDTGLVVLAAPLPERFRIRWTLDPRNGRLVPDMNDVAALRVLPHYRAPVQGPRTLTVLGSGDSTRRFARYVATLDAGIGSAVIPLGLSGVSGVTGDLDGITTGNLEVLSFDPEKASWTRWLRHDRLSRAKKVPAFELGFRPITAGQIPISVTFGDGTTGQLLPTGTGNLYLRATRIGAATTWLAQRRPVRIAPISTPGKVVTVMKGVAAPASQRFRIEHSAPAELIGAADLAARQWQPAVELTVTAPDGLPRTYREISDEDARHGAHGFVLETTPDMPPGVAFLQLYTPAPLAGATVTAWQLPGSRQWALDAAFYRDLLPDLTVQPGATSLQLLSTAGLRTGSLLAVFPDADSAPDIVTLASVDPPTWSAELTLPLTRAYDLDRSFLRGNVVGITQGAVDAITIGSSDGVTASLRLPLQNRLPLLHVIEDGVPVPAIDVLVAGQLWTPVFDFTRATPTDRVWRLDIDASGSAFVQFGDGQRGAIPPAGNDDIVARVRTGDGASGNLPAGAINKLVSDNLAVKSTASLRPSAGGSAGGPPGVTRDKAFAHRLPSDRVVTASDCVRIAIGESGVIAAALDPTADPGAIRLVVAMQDRRAPTDDDLRKVGQRITGAMPATARVPVEVIAAEQRAVHIVVEIGVLEGHAATDVFAAVRAAFGAGPGGFFAADRWDIGEPLGLGAIYDALFHVAGVASARVVWMAGEQLLEGAPAPGPAPDAFDPRATGVVRCDNDPVGDPFGRLGTFRIQPSEAP